MSATNRVAAKKIVSFFTIMAQSSSGTIDIPFLEKAVEGIADPYILAVVIVSCTAIVMASSIIKAASEAFIRIRRNSVETEGLRKRLESEIRALEDKRLRKKRREKS